MSTDSDRYALIDTDPGIDDALALLLAWGSPEWTVEVVTVVAGNAPLEACARNVFRLLDLRRPLPAPLVATGAARPQIEQPEDRSEEQRLNSSHGYISYAV